MLLIGLLVAVPLFPTDMKSFIVIGYSISEYSFAVTGKTKEESLRHDVVPPVEPVYDTQDALIMALDGKRQALLNRRLFNSVSYSHALTEIVDSIAYYGVLFTVGDASSFFVLPYPKYSTDDGIRFGVKGSEKNLFGTYSQFNFVVNTTQTAGRDKDTFWDWSRREDFFQIDFDNLQLGSAIVDMDTEFSGRLFSHGEYKLDVNVKEIPFFGATLRFNPSIKGTREDDSSWTVSEYKLITDLGTLMIGGSRHSWYNEIILTGQTSDAIAAITTIRRHDLSVLSHPIAFSLTWDAAADLRDSDGNRDFIPTRVKVGPDVGTEFSLPLGFRWSTNIASRLNIPRKDALAYWMTISFSNTLSRSDINWHDDFRTGSTLKLRFDMDWFMIPEPELMNPLDSRKAGWTAEAQFTWFPFATKVFNPSLRIVGHYSDTARKLLPLENEDITIADNMRGILESNSTVRTSGNDRTFALIGNFNFTTRFITLESFIKTYVSPFIDVGIFSNMDAFSMKTEDYDWLGTIGVEGIGILSKFPSFPIRASLGVNLKDIIDYAKGIKSASGIEHEIFIGMDFFF